MSTMAGPGIANIVTGALKGYMQGTEAKYQMQQRREEARYQQKVREYELNRLGMQQAKAPMEMEQLQLQLQEARTQAEEANTKLAEQTTYKAFDAYTADGNEAHLNRTLTNPIIREAFPGTRRFEKLNLANPNDRALLIQNNIAASEEELIQGFANVLDEQKFLNTYLKAIDDTGQVSLANIPTMMASTRYTEYKSKQELERLKAWADITKKMEGPKPTVMEQKAESAAAAKERIAAGIGTEKDRQIVRFATAETAGTIPGKLEQANVATDELLMEFGGEEPFFNTDFSDRSNRTKAYKYITQIESLEDVKYTEAEKKKLDSIRELIALGDTATTMSGEATGIIDSLVNTAKKYIDEEAGDDVGATSAYAAFRNSVRNALYGSALTEAEILSFNEAFGTIKMQEGPVLRQFETALRQVQAKLESVATMGNPYVAHYRLGVDQAKLDGMISALQQRIDFIKQRNATGAPTAPTNVDNADEDAQLKEIFGVR